MDNIKDISKQPIIEWGGQVVITTSQLAEVYGATKDNISDNFNRNKDRFTLGKHYILLTGAELKEFKSQSAESGLVAKTASQLYLWTRRGASRHCKILGTDKAWEQFDYLEENYFDRQDQKQLQLPQTTDDKIALLAQGHTELRAEVDEIKAEVKALKDDMPVFTADAKDIQRDLRKKAVEKLGGYKSNAYNDRSIRGFVFADIQRELKRQFDVKRYDQIKHKDTGTALEIIGNYQLPLALKNRVDMANNQQRLDV